MLFFVLLRRPTTSTNRGPLLPYTTLFRSHQPSSPLNKEVAFYDAAFGCEALSDALPLYYTKLVKSGLISKSKLIELTVKNPAESINLESGEIKVGQKANALLFDINKETTINNSQSLYNGESLYGEITKYF